MVIIKNKIGKLNNVTKILLIILVVAVSYFIIFLVLKPLLIRQPTSMMGIMNQMMTGGTKTDINLLSLITSLIIGVVVSFYLFREQKEEKKGREYEIIKKLLSGDENKILNEIKKAKEITQDSLRFRLNWSKAKISTILTNLDRKGLIQRERIGKTYKVYLQKRQE